MRRCAEQCLVRQGQSSLTNVAHPRRLSVAHTRPQVTSSQNVQRRRVRARQPNGFSVVTGRPDCGGSLGAVSRWETRTKSLLQRALEGSSRPCIFRVRSTSKVPSYSVVRSQGLPPPHLRATSRRGARTNPCANAGEPVGIHGLAGSPSRVPESTGCGFGFVRSGHALGVDHDRNAECYGPGGVVVVGVTVDAELVARGAR